jgi:hippurate hydrolase
LHKIAGTGVIYDVTDGDSKDGICIRADIDALPQKETTGLPCACTTGAAHSCGHDGHTATLLAASQVLIKQANKIPPGKRLRLLFQPAEETFQGAERVIAENGISQINEIYALHNHGSSTGTIKIKQGSMLSGVLHFKISIKGKSSHGSFPDKGFDPITAMSYVHTSLHTLMSMGACDSAPRAACTVGCVQGGTAFNIIPETAVMEGSLRVFSNEMEEKMMAGIRSIVETVPCAFGCLGKLEVKRKIPPVINHKVPMQHLLKAVESVMGREAIVQMKSPEMSSEDFALYTERIPGAYFFFGGRDPGTPLIINHNSSFDYNDKIIGPSALIWIKLIEQRFGIEF